MGYQNPYKARMARWKKLWPVPVAELQAQAFSVLQLAYEGVCADDPDERRKAILCYFQALTSLTKLFQSGELEARIAALEAQRFGDLSHASNGREP